MKSVCAIILSVFLQCCLKIIEDNGLCSHFWKALKAAWDQSPLNNEVRDPTRLERISSVHLVTISHCLAAFHKRGFRVHNRRIRCILSNAADTFFAAATFNDAVYDSSLARGCICFNWSPPNPLVPWKELLTMKKTLKRVAPFWPPSENLIVHVCSTLRPVELILCCIFLNIPVNVDSSEICTCLLLFFVPVMLRFPSETFIFSLLFIASTAFLLLSLFIL